MRILWKIIKVLGNVVGVLLSVLVSAALLVSMLVAPVMSGVTHFTQPETVRQVVQNVDFKQIILDSLTGLVDVGAEKEYEFLLDLAETNAFRELVELYVTDLTGILDRDEEPGVLTEEALRKIMEDNMDELVQTVRVVGQRLKEDLTSYTDEDIADEIREYFDEAVHEFLEIAPTIEDLRRLITQVVSGFADLSATISPLPGSGMGFAEDSFDNRQDSAVSESVNGGAVSIVTPGEGGSVTMIIPGEDGVIRDSEGNVYYVTVDPDSGAVKIEDANGNNVENFVVADPDSGTAVGGFVTFGSPVALRSRVLAMSISPVGGGQPGGPHIGGIHIESVVDFILNLIAMVQDGTITYIFIALTIVLALLLCLLRWPRFKGFMWLAVVLLIGAVLLALTAAAVVFTPTALTTAIGALGFPGASALVSVVVPVISIFTNRMFIAAGIYAGVAIVLIILFIIFRVILKKQKKAKAARNKAKTIEQIADDAEANAIAAAQASICEEPEEESEEEPSDEIDDAAEEQETEEETEEEPAEESVAE